MLINRLNINEVQFNLATELYGRFGSIFFYFNDSIKNNTFYRYFK